LNLALQARAEDDSTVMIAVVLLLPMLLLVGGGTAYLLFIRVRPLLRLAGQGMGFAGLTMGSFLPSDY
jgi:hypothetical protein